MKDIDLKAHYIMNDTVDNFGSISNQKGDMNWVNTYPFGTSLAPLKSYES